MTNTDAPFERSSSQTRLALGTIVEHDFVAPLTALRGALEILRDFPDLTKKERAGFIDKALQGCAKLEDSVCQLADTVYAAGRGKEPNEIDAFSDGASSPYAMRINLLDKEDIIEIDFSDFVFSSTDIVNAFYDVIDEVIKQTGRKWYFLVNYHECRVWPEAWVAFAHRGQKVNESFSLGTVHYNDMGDAANKASDEPLAHTFDPNLYDSRERAIAAIEDMKK